MKIYEEISTRCQRQRDKIARQQERLKAQRKRILEAGLAGLSFEATSQSLIDDVAYSLLETLYDDYPRLE